MAAQEGLEGLSEAARQRIRSVRTTREVFSCYHVP
jgi:hypothetical protein